MTKKSTKQPTEHQIRKDELEKIKRHILEHELMLKLVEETPRPRLDTVESIFLKAPIQEAVVYAAAELQKLMLHYQENGHKFSYRDFLVTDAAVGIICENKRCKWFVKLAYNTKPHANQAKYCAEMRVMKAMKQNGAKLVGMVVLGYPQPGDKTLALHPCDLCRRLMKTEYKDIMLPHSRIILVHPEDPRREGFTVRELLAHHSEEF